MATIVVYLTIIPRVRVGYEMADRQRGAYGRVGYNHLISNKREWNNCFIKNAHKISTILPDFICQKKKTTIFSLFLIMSRRVQLQYLESIIVHIKRG